MTRYYTSTAQDTTLTSAVNSTATTIAVTSIVGYPSQYPYIIALDYNTASEELVQVNSVSGTSFSVTRGYNSTSATNHGVGAVVRHVITAQDMTDAQNHYAATTSVHGITDTSVLATQSTATDVSNATSFLNMGA